MNKTEKAKIKNAIALLMTDEGFDEALDILAALVGTERAVTKSMKDPSAKTVSIFDLWKDEPRP